MPEAVRRHEGVLVYAGGDDVLAMAPLETAIPLALLFEIYEASFHHAPSACGASHHIRSFIYAHYNTLLTGVIRECALFT